MSDDDGVLSQVYGHPAAGGNFDTGMDLKRPVTGQSGVEGVVTVFFLEGVVFF